MNRVQRGVLVNRDHTDAKADDSSVFMGSPNKEQPGVVGRHSRLEPNIESAKNSFYLGGCQQLLQSKCGLAGSY